jgi:hypothetical protein
VTSWYANRKGRLSCRTCCKINFEIDRSISTFRSVRAWNAFVCSTICAFMPGISQRVTLRSHTPSHNAGEIKQEHRQQIVLFQHSFSYSRCALSAICWHAPTCHYVAGRTPHPFQECVRNHLTLEVREYQTYGNSKVASKIEGSANNATTPDDPSASTN